MKERLYWIAINELSEDVFAIINRAINSGDPYKLRATGHDGNEVCIDVIIVKVKIKKGLTTIYYKKNEH